MPRTGRIIPLEAAMHIICRGNNKQNIFNQEEERRKQYVDFVVDNSIINSGRLSRQLFIGSEAFIRKSCEYYHIRNENLKRGRPKTLLLEK